jgi:hypothetical protein
MGNSWVHKTIFLRVSRLMLQHGWRPSEKARYFDLMYRDIRYVLERRKRPLFEKSGAKTFAPLGL